MRGPSWLAGILAALMIATAAYCASRLVIARARRRADERDVNLVHTVMGVAMAGMLVSWLNPLPDRVWAVMFGAATGWFGWRAWRGRRARAAAGERPAVARSPRAAPGDVRRHGLHAAGRRRGRSGGIGPASRDGRGRAARRWPLPAPRPGPGRVHGGLRDVASRPPARPGPRRDRPPRRFRPGGQPRFQHHSRRRTGLPARRGHTETLPASPAPRALSPRLAACCQIAMAVTMGYMLILML